MTERPEEIQHRLSGLEEIGQVVGALRAIASGHTAAARAALDAIEAHAATVAGALAQLGGGALPAPEGPGLMLVVGAAQGFSGAYPLRLAEAARAALPDGAGLVVVGSRTLSMLDSEPLYDADLPGHPREVPPLASALTDQLLALSEAHPGPILLVGGRDLPGQPVETRRLWPPEAPVAATPAPARTEPLTNLPRADLIEAVLHEALFAQVMLALIEGLRAESQARVEAMTRAQSNLKRKRLEVEQDYARARQDQMTDEMIELTMGR